MFHVRDVMLDREWTNLPSDRLCTVRARGAQAERVLWESKAVPLAPIERHLQTPFSLHPMATCLCLQCASQ
jgi:hypothetical protein